MKEGCGAFDYRSAEGLIAVKWFDNKCVNHSAFGIMRLSAVELWWTTTQLEAWTFEMKTEADPGPLMIGRFPAPHMGDSSVFRGREAQRRWFPPGLKFVFTVGVNHFHVLSWSRNNTRELCCIRWSRRLYSQPNCRLYCTLYCPHYYCYSFRFSFLSHSFTVRTYVHSLTLARPLTPYAPTPHAPPYSWKGLCQSYNNGNWRTIDMTWTPSSFT